MSIINTLPLTLTNGTTADATQVMSLFAWIQSQTNGNAAPATVGTSILKGDGAGGTTAAVAGTDYAPVASPTFTGTVTAPTFVGALTGDVTGDVSGANVIASTVMSLAGSTVTTFANFTFGTVANVGNWMQFPSGVIIQIGAGASSGSTYPNASVTWPIPFPSSCLGCVASIVTQGTGGTYSIETGILGTTTGTFVTKLAGNPVAAAVPFNWISMGI